MRVDLNNGQCGTPASRRSVMTVRNSSRPIARVFRATAAPGCRDELLQRFHSSSAALVNSKVGCLKYRILEPVDASTPDEYRYASGSIERMRGLISDTLASKVDIIVPHERRQPGSRSGNTRSCRTSRPQPTVARNPPAGRFPESFRRDQRAKSGCLDH